MSKRIKPKKLDAVTQAAKDLAIARRRLDLAGKRREKALEELARSIAESNDAAIETAQAEFAFEEAAIAAARKKFGLPDPQDDRDVAEAERLLSDRTQKPVPFCCPPFDTAAFTYSIGKPQPPRATSGEFTYSPFFDRNGNQINP